MNVKVESEKVGLKVIIQKTNGIWSHHFMGNRWGKIQTNNEKSYDQARQHIKKLRDYFAHKGLSSQGYVFSSGHAWM